MEASAMALVPTTEVILNQVGAQMRQSTGHPGCDCGGEMGRLGREYLA